MAVALCFVLALAIPAAEDVKVVEAGEEAEVVETAATVQLTRTEGDVTVTNAVGRAVSRLTKLRLYSGYHLNTDQKSYAWVALDDERLAKLDAASALEIRKKGKALELLLESGSVYFNIAKPLEEDESLNICTSSMIIGIRGTSGWVDVIDRNKFIINILEGTVSCTVSDPVSGEIRSISVSGGESVAAGIAPEGGIQEFVVQRIEREMVSGFVLKELVENAELCQEIFEKTGLDFRNITAEEADRRQAQDEAEDASAYEEMIKALSMQTAATEEKPSDSGFSYSSDSDDSAGGSDSGSSGSSDSDDDNSGDLPPALGEFSCDGSFMEWSYCYHDDKELGEGINSGSALYMSGGVLYGHVFISHPDTTESMKDYYLESDISFDGGINTKLRMVELTDTVPEGVKTYEIKDSSDSIVGMAKSFVSVNRDDMEFEINLNDIIGSDPYFSMVSIWYNKLGLGSSFGGVPTGAGPGLALCLSSVGIGYAWKRKKKPEHRKNK